MTRRVPTVRELREELDDEEAAAEASDAEQRGRREFEILRWEAEELSSMCRKVSPKRPCLEWAMVLRMAAFRLEELAYPHRQGRREWK